MLLLLLLLLLLSATSRVSRENRLSQRVQNHLQRIGCQHVQWPISCTENCESLLLLLLWLLLTEARWTDAAKGCAVTSALPFRCCCCCCCHSCNWRQLVMHNWWRYTLRSIWDDDRTSAWRYATSLDSGRPGGPFVICCWPIARAPAGGKACRRTPGGRQRRLLNDEQRRGPTSCSDHSRKQTSRWYELHQQCRVPSAALASGYVVVDVCRNCRRRCGPSALQS